MQVKRAPIKLQDYDKVIHIDASATHWALEHARHTAAAQDALGTFKDLTAAKSQVVTDLCKAAGLDMKNIVQARLTKDGDSAYVEVVLQEDPAPPAAEPEAPPPEPAPAPAS